jgi:hypothetical protein
MTSLQLNILQRIFLFSERKADSQGDRIVKCLNLKSVCTISLPNELNTGFCLQSMNEFMVLKTKTDAEILMYGRSLGNHSSKINLSATKRTCSSYEPADGLNINEKRIFSTCSHQQKNDLMLNPSLFSRCILKNNILKLALLSAYSSENGLLPILGCLSNNGSLELSRYSFDFDNFESRTEKIAEVCEIRKQSYELGTYTKLEKLQEIVNEVSFYTFDWCPEVVENLRFFAAMTKSNEIIIYSINCENDVAVHKFLKLDTVTCEIKWIVRKNEHFLITFHQNKIVARYAIIFSKDIKVTSLQKVDEMEGKLNIPPSFIEVQSFGDDLLMMCAKSHSIEIVYLNESGFKSVTKHIGLSITGITNISSSSPEYLVSTLDNKVFYLKLTIVEQKVQVEECYTVNNSQNPDIQPSKFGAYGLTASKNKVLVFLALFPQLVRIKDSNVIAQ